MSSQLNDYQNQASMSQSILHGLDISQNKAGIVKHVNWGDTFN